MQNKIFSLLVLLMTAATGAWADDYYLVGNMNDWGASKQFQLTQNPGNTAEYMITLTFKAGAKFKVIGVEEGKETEWYPSGGDETNYYVSNAGEYTVYFRPDGEGDPEYWYHRCIYLAAAPAPAVPVTDLGNNTWEFTMPNCAVVANIEYDTDLELREENVNTTVLADWDGYDADVTMHRTLKAGIWNTLTMPYNIPAGFLSKMKEWYDITAVKELTDATLTDGTLNLTFDDAASIVAGKPYLVRVENDFDFSTQGMTNVTVSKTLQPFTSTYVDFIPTLGKTEITGTDAKKILFINDNTLKHPKELPAYMKGFRAYFQLKGDAANAASFNLDFGNGETTGINSLTSEPSSNGEGSIYSLDGRRLSGKPAQKGVYIVNGKKMVIK